MGHNMSDLQIVDNFTASGYDTLFPIRTLSADLAISHPGSLAQETLSTDGLDGFANPCIAGFGNFTDVVLRTIGSGDYSLFKATFSVMNPLPATAPAPAPAPAPHPATQSQ
jgi:hypothetical protein